MNIKQDTNDSRGSLSRDSPIPPLNQPLKGGEREGMGLDARDRACGTAERQATRESPEAREEVWLAVLLGDGRPVQRAKRGHGVLRRLLLRLLLLEVLLLLLHQQHMLVMTLRLRLLLRHEPTGKAPARHPVDGGDRWGAR